MRNTLLFDMARDGWVFRADEDTLMRALASELDRYGYRQLERGSDFLYAPGQVPVLLVAHVDTVHVRPPEDIYHDAKAGVLWSPDGLGADDRAGVLGILHLLRLGHRPHVLFTDGEERGGTGAHEAAKALHPDVRYVVELDRRNGREAVFYGCENKKFRKYVTAFGYKQSEGTFTDISILCPAWGIAGVNVSCGYYNAHTTTEYLKLPELEDSVRRVAAMLKNVPKAKFDYGPRVVRRSVFGFGRGVCWHEARGGVYDGDYGESYDDYWGAGRSRYGSCRWGHTVCDEILYVSIEPEELVYRFGGSVEDWAQWLEDHRDELEGYCEDAVLQYIERKVNEGGLPGIPV